MRKIFALLLLLATGASAREKLYADANMAHLGPVALRKLASLKAAGVTEILVPTWFPSDLQNGRVKLDTKDTRWGPNLEIVYPSNTRHRSLLVRGTGGGVGGPGPDYSIPVQNPTLGKIDLWYCDKSPMAYLYCMPWWDMKNPHGDRNFLIDVDTEDRSHAGLSRPEMIEIVRSLRYFHI